MKINLMPKNTLGKWAVGLSLVMVFSMALSLVLGLVIGGDISVLESSPLISIIASILSLAFTLAMPLSLIVGIMAIVKYKEWIVLKSLAILYILTLLLFLSSKLIF